MNAIFMDALFLYVALKISSERHSSDHHARGNQVTIEEGFLLSAFGEGKTLRGSLFSRLYLRTLSYLYSDQVGTPWTRHFDVVIGCSISFDVVISTLDPLMWPLECL